MKNRKFDIKVFWNTKKSPKKEKLKSFVKYIIPIIALIISVATYRITIKNSEYSIKVAEKALKTEKEYNKQAEALLLSTLNYSLANNEKIMNKLVYSNTPTKTFEQYYLEYKTAQTNYKIIEKIDLSQLNKVNMLNVQAYMYFYPQYLLFLDENLNRLKDRSDVLKEMINNGTEVSLAGEDEGGKTLEEIKSELLESEYKVDWILVEERSVILQSFVQYLINSRTTLEQLKEGVEKGEVAEGIDIEKDYKEFLNQNEKIITYESSVEK